MKKATVYYEWIVWFEDGHIIPQHKQNGEPILWDDVVNYHDTTSHAKRVGFVPFSKRRAELASRYYKREFDAAYNASFEKYYQNYIDQWKLPVKPDRMDPNQPNMSLERYEKKLKEWENMRKTPFDRDEFRKLTYSWKDNCVAKVLPSHFMEVHDGRLPFMKRRLKLDMSLNAQKFEYFYIMGSGGRKVLDDQGNIHFVGGYYMAIDKNGHTRLDNISNIFIPIIPPDAGDNNG